VQGRSRPVASAVPHTPLLTVSCLRVGAHCVHCFAHCVKTNFVMEGPLCAGPCAAWGTRRCRWRTRSSGAARGASWMWVAAAARCWRAAWPARGRSAAASSWTAPGCWTGARPTHAPAPVCLGRVELDGLPWPWRVGWLTSGCCVAAGAWLLLEHDSACSCMRGTSPLSLEVALCCLGRGSLVKLATCASGARDVLRS